MCAAHGKNQALIKHFVHKGAHVWAVSKNGETADCVPGGAGVLRQPGLRRRREEAMLCVQGDAVLRDGVSGRALACAPGGLPAADRRRGRGERRGIVSRVR
jgi:hypothetical protein